MTPKVSKVCGKWGEFVNDGLYSYMRKIISILTISMFFVISIAPFALPWADIPADTLQCPVLLKCGDSRGSGFFINTGKGIFFVTAGHVLFKRGKNEKGEDVLTDELISDAATLMCYPEGGSTYPNEIEMLLNKLNSNKNVRLSKISDVAVVKIGIVKEDRVDIDLLDGVIYKGKGGIVSIHTDYIKKYDETLIGNEVYVYGYPSSIGRKGKPQISYSRPLLRKGIIAGKYGEKGTIIIDCPVYYGNSGSPVIEVETVIINEKLGKKFNLIGVAIEFVPFNFVVEDRLNQFTYINAENTGYSVVVPIDVVLNLLEH